LRPSRAIPPPRPPTRPPLWNRWASRSSKTAPLNCVGKVLPTHQHIDEPASTDPSLALSEVLINSLQRAIYSKPFDIPPSVHGLGSPRRAGPKRQSPGASRTPALVDAPDRDREERPPTYLPVDITKTTAGDARPPPSPPQRRPAHGAARRRQSSGRRAERHSSRRRATPRDASTMRRDAACGADKPTRKAPHGARAGTLWIDQGGPPRTALYA